MATETEPRKGTGIAAPLVKTLTLHLVHKTGYTTKAQELWVESSDLFTRMQGDILLSEGGFSAIAHMDASGEFEPIYNWLKQLPVADDPLIIVLWGQEICVLTLWSVLCLYWDDSCYPMSDDVAVWPLSEAWALVYAHYEKIIFGVRRTEA